MISLQPLTLQNSSMMDRYRSALNPGKNAHTHTHKPHGCYPSCGCALVVVWNTCVSSMAHPHRLHTDAVLLPFTLLLVQHQLIHKQTHHTKFYPHSVFQAFVLCLFSLSCSGEQKRCPLCEVIFPPHYDQSKFEEHVESHWKICPMCSEQFPLDCDQQLFEKHVLTHFDSNVLNF